MARALHGQTVLVSRPAKMVSLWEVTAILAPPPRAVFFSSILCQIKIKRKKNELRDDTYIHTYTPFLAIFLRNEIHFSDVCRGIDYVGSRARLMNPSGIHVKPC